MAQNLLHLLIPLVLEFFLGIFLVLDFDFPDLSFDFSCLSSCFPYVGGSLQHFKLHHVLNDLGHGLGERLETDTDNTPSPLSRYHLSGSKPRYS